MLHEVHRERLLDAAVLQEVVETRDALEGLQAVDHRVAALSQTTMIILWPANTEE